MSKPIENEEWCSNNPDGGISLDPWAGMTRKALKERCGELTRALDEWYFIARIAAEEGKDSLPPHWRKKLDDMIEAYRD